MSKPSLSVRLRQVIHALGVTDKAFAEAAKITRQTLSGYLNLGRDPNGSTLANWVTAYNLNARWLLTGEGDDMFLADHQAPPTSPLVQRVNQVVHAMGNNADELDVLRATRAMIDGEIRKLVRERGGSGDAEPRAGENRAAENPAGCAVQAKAAGDDSE